MGSSVTAGEQVVARGERVAAPAGAAAARRRGRGDVAVTLLRLAIVVGLLVLWELASGRWVEALFASSPTRIAARLAELAANGQLWKHSATTFGEIAIGYPIGALLGIVVGYALGQLLPLARVLEPFIVAYYGVPKIALAPLFIVWLGIGLASKIFFVVAMVFFVNFFNTYNGVRLVDRQLVNLARLMGASGWRVALWVVLPQTLPFILTGLRVTVPFAVIGAIVAEFTASTAGLGWYVHRAAQLFDTAGVFAGVVVLFAFTWTANALLRALEDRLLRWHPERGQVQQVT